MVRYSRANFLVPVPQVRSLDELNARLEESCREDLKRRLRGHGQIKEALLAEELGVMQELPECFGMSTESNRMLLKHHLKSCACRRSGANGKPRQRAADRGASRPSDPPGPHHRGQRRELSSQGCTQKAQKLKEG